MVGNIAIVSKIAELFNKIWIYNARELIRTNTKIVPISTILEL